jgi:hypothetical protein
MTREAGEGRIDSPSYHVARSRSRLFVSSSPISERLRQRASCAFKNELSINSPTQPKLRARLPPNIFSNIVFPAKRGLWIRRNKSFVVASNFGFWGCGYVPPYARSGT